MHVSLPAPDSDGQILISGNNEISRALNEFLGDLRLLSSLCIYVFIYSCFLLCVLEFKKREWTFGLLLSKLQCTVTNR